jgi:hypothetical protein
MLRLQRMAETPALGSWAKPESELSGNIQVTSWLGLALERLAQQRLEHGVDRTFGRVSTAVGYHSAFDHTRDDSHASPTGECRYKRRR